MIKRDVQSLLKEMTNSFHVVTITGSHHSGKIILVKQTYPEMDYISLEELDIRYQAEREGLITGLLRKVLETERLLIFVSYLSL